MFPSLVFLQSFERYRVLRTAESLVEGEELTFMTSHRVFDLHLGYPFFEVVFVEKSLSVYVPDDEPTPEVLLQPELFFEKIGHTDRTVAEQSLVERRRQDRLQALEEDQQRMWELAHKKLQKHQKKSPKG
jgi:hypothetical protein